MVAAAALVPFAAHVLGMQVAGMIWSAGRLTLPFLSQCGDVVGGALGGAAIGLAQWAILPRVPSRWIAIAALAGVGVGLAHALYPPSTVLAAPVAGALAAVEQTRLLPNRGTRWVRAPSLAAAWAALALLLPFPGWAAALFLLGAALLTAWGISSP
jgi:hypothetical protein